MIRSRLWKWYKPHRRSSPHQLDQGDSSRSGARSSYENLRQAELTAVHPKPSFLLPPQKTVSLYRLQIVSSIVNELVNNVVSGEQTVDPETTTSQDTSRDFADVLADALDPSQPTLTPTDETGTDDPPPLLKWYQERCAQQQRDIIAEGVKFSKMSDYAASLEATVSLLNQDLTEKTQEIKRLQAAVDKGRLKVSQATGIRHHLESGQKQPDAPSCNLPKGTTGGKKSTPPNATEETLKAIQAELAANRAEIIELKNQVSSAFAEADSDQTGFTTVHSRKSKRRNPPPPQHQPTSQPQHPTPASYPAPPTYSDITSGRAPKPDTITFGTSLARGTGRVLRNHGTRVLEYNFPGADLPRLREKIVPILEKNPQVTKVILVAGGNDCEKEGVSLQQIKAEYDALIDTIKLQQGWDCKVIISSVPQRRRATTETRHKIAGLNLEHYYHSDPDSFVYFVDSAPKLGCYFYDRVHLNYVGLDYWARKITGFLSTFQPTASTSSM